MCGNLSKLERNKPGFIYPVCGMATMSGAEFTKDQGQERAAKCLIWNNF